MAILRWSAIETVENILTTELNSLGAGSRAITSSAIVNVTATTERWIYADFEMYVNTQTTRTGSPQIQMYILPTVDGGSTYPTGSSSITPSPELIACVFNFPADATAHRTICRAVMLPPSDFYVLVVNNTSQALNATSNTLRMSKYSVEG